MEPELRPIRVILRHRCRGDHSHSPLLENPQRLIWVLGFLFLLLSIAFPQKLAAVWSDDGWKDVDRVFLIGENWENRRAGFPGPGIVGRSFIGFENQFRVCQQVDCDDFKERPLFSRMLFDVGLIVVATAGLAFALERKR